MSKELIEEAEYALMDNDLDISLYVGGTKYVNGKRLVERLLAALKERDIGWECISASECGCEIRKSNKGNYFADCCNECTNLPPAPEGE